MPAPIAPRTNDVTLYCVGSTPTLAAAISSSRSARSARPQPENLRRHAMITEIVRGFVDGYYLDVLDIRLPISQGRGSAPTGPGLGAHLRDDFRSRSDVSTRQSTAP